MKYRGKNVTRKLENDQIRSRVSRYKRCFYTVRSNEYGRSERKIFEKNRKPRRNAKGYRGKNKQRIEKA